MKAILAAVTLLLCAATGICQGEITLRPGDTIAVSCSEEASFNLESKVAPDGTIRLAVVGLVVVFGLTEGAAADRLTVAVRARGWSRATIAVRLIATAIEPITYSGAVETGGAMLYRPGLRLREVLLAAKATPSADLTRLTITSRNGGVQTIDASNPQANPAISDPILQPGDRVFVPLLTQASEVYLLGAVVQPGSVPFVRGMTARKVVEAMGGAGRHANISRARIVKSNGEEWPLDLGPFGRDIDLEPGDKIYVPLVDKQRFVSVVGAVANPGAVDYSPNLSVEEAVSAAGGFLPDANPRGVRVRRVVASADALPNSLRPFDIIEVPFVGSSGNKFVRAALNLMGILLVLGR